MRKRIDEGGVDGQQRVEEVCEANTARFRDEPQRAAVCIETPRTSHRGDLDRGFAISVEKFIAEAPRGVLVGQLNDGRAVPFDVHDRNQAVGQDALHRSAACHFFKASHLSPFSM